MLPLSPFVFWELRAICFDRKALLKQMNCIWGSIFEVVSDVINEASFLQIDSEQSHPDDAWAKLKDGMSRFRRLQKGS